jgi:hypothetical protein
MKNKTPDKVINNQVLTGYLFLNPAKINIPADRINAAQ